MTEKTEKKQLVSMACLSGFIDRHHIQYDCNCVFVHTYFFFFYLQFCMCIQCVHETSLYALSNRVPHIPKWPLLWKATMAEKLPPSEMAEWIKDKCLSTLPRGDEGQCCQNWVCLCALGINCYACSVMVGKLMSYFCSKTSIEQYVKTEDHWSCPFLWHCSSRGIYK